MGWLLQGISRNLKPKFLRRGATTLLLLFQILAPIAFGVFPTSIAEAAAGVPKIISYQGRLLNSSGTLLGSSSGTNYYFKFSIWDSPTSSPSTGNRLWPIASPGVTTSTVTSGVFNVSVGDTANGYPDALTYDFTTEANVYLQVEVSETGSSFETLSPRQRISASGFAINSDTVSGSLRATSTTDYTFNVQNVGGGNANLSVQGQVRVGVFTAPPTALGGGSLYYSSSTGNLFVWNEATTTPQWVSLGGGSGGSTTDLQAAYNLGNTITTTNARDLTFNLAQTATDANFKVNLMGTSTGVFEVQASSTRIFSISRTNVTSTAALTWNIQGAATLSTTTIGGLLTANTLNSSGVIITGGSLNNTPIGASGASSATFTSATTTGTFTAQGVVSLATTSISSGNLNIVAGVFQLGGNTRIDNAGQATFTTSSISSLTVIGTSTFTGALAVGNLTFSSATSTGTTNLANLIVGTLSGLLKANNGVVGTATSGVDYEAPIASATGTFIFFGDKTFKQASTTNITEGTNLYFTSARVLNLLTFATSGASGITIASSSGTWTWSQSTSTASQPGFLSSADWTTFNAKQDALTFPLVFASTTHVTILGSTYIGASTANGTTTLTNNGVQTLTAGNNVTISSATGTPTISVNLTFATSGNSGLQIASSSGTWTWSQATSSASSPGFLSSADWTTFNAKQNALTFPLDFASTTHVTILGSTYIGASTVNGTTTITNNGVQTLTAGSNITLSATTGTPTISVNSTFATSTITNLLFTNATGTGTFAAGTSTVNGNLNISSGGVLQLGGNTRIDALGQATLTTSSITALTLTMPLSVSSGGSGANTFTRGVLIASGTNVFSSLSGADGKVLTASSTAPFGFSFETVSSTGGIGISSLNGLVASVQTFSTTTNYAGGFNIQSSGSNHAFNFPGRINDINNLATTTGNLIVASGTTWFALGVGTDGKVLTASSTAAGGISWETAASSGITSLNGSTSSTQTFATSGNTGLTISTLNGVHTWTIATSSATQPGFLSSADWTTFNAKQNALTFPLDFASTTHVTILGSTYIGASTANGTTTLTNNGVQTLTAGNNVTISSATGTPTISVNLTFATSGNSGLQIASSSGTWTWSQATSTASVSGFLSSADWIAFNNKLASFGGITASSSSITAGAGIQISTTTSNLTIVNGGVTSLTGTTYLGVSNSTGSVTLTNNGVQTLSAGEGILVSSATGTPSVTLNMAGGTCSVGSHLFSLSATGTITCTADTSPGSFTTTTITVGGVTLSSTAYTFATSGNTGNSISGSGSTITFTQATSSATQAGFLAAADFATFVAKQDALTFPLVFASTTHVTILGSTYIGASTVNGTTTITNNGVQTLTAGNNVTISSATGTPTISVNLTFATSGNSGLQIASSSGTWTWSQATSSGSQAGFLAAADFASFNNKLASFGGITASSSSITAGAGIQISTTTSNLTITNGGVQTLSAGAGILVSTATGTPSVTLNMAGGTCSGSDKVSSISSTGTIVCTADLQGGGSFTTTTITIGGTTLSSTAYTFATSGNTGNSISGSGSTITFTQATSSASQNGFLSSADWTTFNAKQNALTFPLDFASTTHVTILGSTYIGASTANGTTTLTNNGVQTLTAYATSGLNVSIATGTVAINLNMLGGTCSGTDKVSSVSPTGTIVCSTDLQGSGSFTTTTINGLSSTAYTFVASSGIIISTTSPGTVTFRADTVTTGTTTITSSNSGLEEDGDGIRLLGGCANNEILKWASTTSVWACGSSDYSKFTSIAYTNVVNDTGVVNDQAEADVDVTAQTSANATRVLLGYDLVFTAQSTGDAWQAHVMPNGEAQSTDNIIGMIEDNDQTAAPFVNDGGQVIVALDAGQIFDYSLDELVTGGTITFRLGVLGFWSPVTTGADLAENYYGDSSLQPGDVVSLDESFVGGVRKSTGRADEQVIGVVSTNPAIVLDDVYDSNAGVQVLDKKYEGRVPVAVGLAGRIPVNVSIENGPIEAGDYLTQSSIPSVAMKATKAGKVLGQALFGHDKEEIGAVMMFINNSFYQGRSLSSLLPSGITIDSGDADEETQRGKMLLSALIGDQVSATSPALISEIFTDRIAAGLVIITPRVITKGLTVDSISTLTAAIAINSDTIFYGRPYFNSDTGGFAVISQSTQSVRVDFVREYLEQPVVNATISLENQGGAENVIFMNDIRYLVTNKTTSGFTIMLNKSAPADIKFSWMALAIKNVNIFNSVTLPPAPPAQEAVPPSAEGTPQPPPAEETPPGDGESPPSEQSPPPPSDEPAPPPPAEETSPTGDVAPLPPSDQSSPPAETTSPSEEVAPLAPEIPPPPAHEAPPPAPEPPPLEVSPPAETPPLAPEPTPPPPETP